MLNSAKKWRLYLFTKAFGNTVVEEETTTSKLVFFFLKEYHINMQSHLKFFYIELPGWLNSAAAEEINLPSLILNKKLGGRMKNSDGVAVVW